MINWYHPHQKSVFLLCPIRWTLRWWTRWIRASGKKEGQRASSPFILSRMSGTCSREGRIAWLFLDAITVKLLVFTFQEPCRTACGASRPQDPCQMSGAQPCSSGVNKVLPSLLVLIYDFVAGHWACFCFNGTLWCKRKEKGWHAILSPHITFPFVVADQVSENFYFDMNSEAVKRMLGSHLGPADISTQVFVTKRLTCFNSHIDFRPVPVSLM